MVYEYTRPRRPVAAMDSGPGPSHSLPSLTGTENHDPRSVHTRGPSYKFGVSLSVRQGPYSPGPCYLPKEKVLRDGYEGGRSYSIYPRIDDTKKFFGPAPGAYDAKSVTLIKSRAPAYSFGVVCPPIKSEQTPGPNAYNTLGENFGRSVESNKRQYPAYTMSSRSKFGGFDEDLTKTPAPGSYLSVSTNTYKKRNPQYSLTARNVAPGDSTQKPGPGAHSPEQINLKHSSPRYTFGIRHSEFEAPLITSVAN